MLTCMPLCGWTIVDYRRIIGSPQGGELEAVPGATSRPPVPAQLGFSGSLDAFQVDGHAVNRQCRDQRDYFPCQIREMITGAVRLQPVSSTLRLV